MAQTRIHKLIFIFSAAVFIIAGALRIDAQSGASSRQNQNTANQADQNLKSSAHVNPSTLAMEFSLPLMSYPGRNGNSLPISLSYSSKLWRMRNKSTIFTGSTIPSRQYVTYIEPIFAERSIAGWTSSMAFPVIEEKTDIYNQAGRPFDPEGSADSFNYYFQQALSSTVTPSLVNNPGLPCGIVCTQQWRYHTQEEGWSDWECTAWDFNMANCNYGGPVESPGGGGLPPTSPPSPEIKTYYVKRVTVRMNDGSTHEFRKSDGVYGYCRGGDYDPDNCEPISPNNWGMYLAVDGSGMKLDRQPEGSKLYLPGGGYFIFPSGPNGSFDKTSLYQATDFYDADGNHSQYQAAAPPTAQLTGGQSTPQKWRVIDTLGRKIDNPLPDSLSSQQQNEGDQDIILPGMENVSAQQYKVKWRHLKPVPCDTNVLTNCGL